MHSDNSLDEPWNAIPGKYMMWLLLLLACCDTCTIGRTMNIDQCRVGNGTLNGAVD